MPPRSFILRLPHGQDFRSNSFHLDISSEDIPPRSFILRVLHGQDFRLPRYII